MMSACKFTPSNNPRTIGFCVRCGRAESHPNHQAIVVSRAEVQSDFLTQLEFYIAERGHFDAKPYVDTVRGRLNAGVERYGDAYLTDGRDMLSELLEECPDLAGYSILELHTQAARGGDPEEIAPMLMEVGFHGAMADFYARAARDARA